VPADDQKDVLSTVGFEDDNEEVGAERGQENYSGDLCVSGHWNPPGTIWKARRWPKTARARPV